MRLLSDLATMISGAIQYSEFWIVVSLLAVLAGNRRHRAVDDLGNLEDPCLVPGLVGDRHLLDAEELADQDRQQRRGSAGLAGEDPGQRLDRVDGGALVDEQAGRPVAPAHIAGDFHDQAEIEAGQVDIAEMTGIDAEARPGLAIALGRRMVPSDNTQGQNTVQLQERTSSPFIAQL